VPFAGVQMSGMDGSVGQPTVQHGVIYRGIAQNSDWLRDGRSGDRIPVEEIFSSPVHTGPGPTQTPMQWATGLFTGGKAAEA